MFYPIKTSNFIVRYYNYGMTTYHISGNQNQDIKDFLQDPKHMATPENASVILYQKNDAWHLLTADKIAPDNTVLYYLTEDDFIAFLDRFNPGIKFNDEEQKIIQDAILMATRELRSTEPSEITSAAAATLSQQPLKPPATNNELCDIKVILEQNDDVAESFKKTTIPAIIGLQDALWMAQSVALKDVLKDIGTHTTNTLASGTQVASIVFGAAASIVTSGACGLFAAKIYEQAAIQQYRTYYHTQPTGDALKLIKRDAKNFGYSVFFSMTAWTIGA